MTEDARYALLIGIGLGVSLTVLAVHYWHEWRSRRPAICQVSRTPRPHLWESRCIDCGLVFRHVELDQAVDWSIDHYRHTHGWRAR